MEHVLDVELGEGLLFGLDEGLEGLLVFLDGA